MRLDQFLVRVLRLVLSLVGERLAVLILDLAEQVPDRGEGLPRQQLHLLRPDDGDSHVLARVGDDGGGKQVRARPHEALLIQAQVGEQ